MPSDIDSPDISVLVPRARLAPYIAVAGDDPRDLEAFYLWCQELALALFADIGRLEVVMRSAMARELSRAFGPEWYAHPGLFDDDAAQSLATAWKHNDLGELRRAAHDPESAVDLRVVESKLVGALMFGFWVQIVGRGSFSGKPPQRVRRIYDATLWRRALSNAFPGQARRDVEHAARIVRSARNRIAHHEHVAWGVALPGQRQRLSVSQVHATVLQLARFIAPEAAIWIARRSSVQRVLSACPVADASQLHL